MSLEQTTPKTATDIAAMLVKPQQEEETLTEGTSTDDEEEISVDEDQDAGSDDTEELEAQSSDEEDEAESDDDADDADEQSFIEINDDDLIEVTIDGEVKLCSIAEAKKALSGEGAYDKRIKEATELRKAAQVEHTATLERLENANRTFNAVVADLDKHLFVAQAEKPSAALKQSNPQAYATQLAAYHEEQEALSAGRQALNALVEKSREALDAERTAYKEEQAAKLTEALPALTNPKEGEALMRSMVEVAKSYGFSEEEINAAMDHRYYLMVADLAKYSGARGKTVNTKDVLSGQKSKRPRKLRSGATSTKARATAAAKQQQAKTDAARKSGKVKDVAQTLIVPKG